MRPTKEYIEERFDEYNRLMFGGKLPSIPVKLSDAKTYLGQCVSHVRTHSDGHREHYDFELRISTRLDLPQDTIDDTIIHEMIHYFIHYNGLTDTSVHGEIFKSIMRSINVSHRRHLTISHKSTPEQRREADSRPRWHVIAILYLRNIGPNKVGIKVLPRTVEKVIQFHRNASASPDVEKIDLYLHNDPYFNIYPTSTALRYHSVTTSEITPHLTTARLLTIENGKLIYTYKR